MSFISRFPESNILNQGLIEWIEECLSVVPQYFWTIPASTSSKYHNDEDNKEGGTVLHTRRMLIVAKELRDIFVLTDYEFNIVQISIILHDTFKCGFNNRENKSKDGTLHTDSLHPVYPRIGFSRTICPESVSDAEVDLIFELVEGHYGKWSPIPQCYPSDFSTLDRREQLKVFVHLCDMVTSRKSIGVSLS
jgi:hypothetical protein